MPWIYKKRPLFLKNNRYFCGSVEAHQKKSRSFLRAKIAAIFTVYIGPRENDDKEYLFADIPGLGFAPHGLSENRYVLVALDEKRNSTDPG